MSIKYLAEDDRPREKFLLKGKAALSDSELLAIILGSGHSQESAIDVARRILESSQNSWQRLGVLSIRDLMKFKGIGEAKAIAIAAALEIGRRKASEKIPNRVALSSAEEAYKIFLPYLSDLKTEEFWALFMNQKNHVISTSQISKGGIANTYVDLRILFKMALDHLATSIIVAHNHPTGNLEPSEADLNITKTIQKAGDLLNIKLLDHLIIGENSFFSFKEENLV